MTRKNIAVMACFLMALVALAGTVAPKLQVIYDAETDSVILHWRAPQSPDDQAFEVERTIGSQATLILLSTKAHEDSLQIAPLCRYSWVDAAAPVETNIAYRVRSRQEQGASPWSKPQTVFRPKPETN